MAGGWAAGGGPAVAALLSPAADDVIAKHLEAQLEVEEGHVVFVYDDAVGPVRFKKGDTLKGNLSTGTGVNLMIDFDAAELLFIERNRIGKAMKALAVYAWYGSQDLVRRVALADIDYNIGLGGIMHWPHFLSAMAAKDYPRAAAEIKSNELWISQVHAARAQRLIAMIETGQWPADIKV